MEVSYWIRELEFVISLSRQSCNSKCFLMRPLPDEVLLS